MARNSAWAQYVSAGPEGGDKGGKYYIQRLPAGTYGGKHTTSRQYDVEAPDVTISDGHAVNVSIPESGVITVYAKASSTP